jgi:hypothetical protein
MDKSGWTTDSGAEKHKIQIFRGTTDMRNLSRLQRFAFYTVLCCIIGVATCVLDTESASAQAGLGSLTGTISDTGKAVVSNAIVTLTNPLTGFSQTVTTNSTGAYHFFALEVTSGYVLRVSAPGFRDAEAKGISTSVGTTISVDVTLQVGARAEIVEVSSDINVEQVQTETSAVSQLIDNEVWQSSPLEERTQNEFAKLVAGATPDSGTGRGFAVNGSRTGTGDFLVDGMDNNDQGQGGAGFTSGGGGAVTTISPDAIQEYRVITHIPPAEYGRTGGFATDTVLKSGTTHWHGSLFEYNRVQALAADDFFSKRSGLTDHLVRNQFGGSVGGPIYKNRTFFYVTAEFHRRRTGSPTTATTTTADFLNFVKSGAFEKFQENDPGGVCLQYLGIACPGGLPHSATLGPVFQKLLAAEPTAFPTGTIGATPVAQGLYTGGVVTYPVNVYATTTQTITDALNQNRGSVKLDHKLTDRDHLSFAYLADLYEDDSSNGAGGGSAFGPAGFNIGGAQNFSVTWTHAFSPTLLNLARAGYLRHVSNFDAPTTHGVSEIYTANDPLGEGFGESAGLPQYFTENEFLYSDSLTKTFQRHVFKTGFQFLRTRNGSSFFNDISGTLLPWDVENLLTDATFNDDLEALMGGPAYGSLYEATASIDPSTKTAPDPYRGFRANKFAAYVQDDWKPTPRLTLNIGLRWDYFGPPHNVKKGFDSNVYFGAFGTPAANGNPFEPQVAIAGALQGATFIQKDSNIWNKDTHSFGPRFGFSYDVLGNGKLAIRGGYGIGFDRLYNNAYENLRFNPPHFADNAFGALVNGVPAGGTLQPGLYAVPFTANAQFAAFGGKPVPRHIDQRLRNAYYEQFSFGVEYELKPGYVWETNYIGTLGRQLVGLDNINTYAGRTACAPKTYAPGTPCYNAGYPKGFTTRRITTLFNNDNFRTNGFNSNYSGFQTSLRKGYSNGLQFMANYTYSKAMDEISDVFKQRNGSTGPQNPYDWAYDYGPADFDLRHNLVVTLNFQSQWKKNNRLLGGWGISPILELRSGTPFSPYDSSGGYNPLKDGRPGTNRAVYTGSGSPKNAISHSQSPATEFLKPGSFADYICPAGQLWCEPAIARNTLTGPASKNLDLGISKRIVTWESQAFTLQGNLFNIFNHTNFDNPVADINNSNFGKSLGDAAGPRVTQLSLRYDF